MEKESILSTIEKLQVMTYNAIGHLTTCNYINHPSKFHEYARYRTNIDTTVLFHVLNHSFHFRQYQYFSWKLYIIEMSKILGGDTDKFSLKKLNNKMKNKLFSENYDFSKQIEVIDTFFESNEQLIKSILALRSSQYAHSDFKNNTISINFNQSWELIKKIQNIFDSFGSLLDYHFAFPDYSDFLSNLEEIESYYLYITDAKDYMSKMYLMSIVDNDYLKKIGLI